MVKTKAEGGRGKDGMLRKFCIDAMGEICGLVPSFDDSMDASRFMKHFMSLKRFQDYVEPQQILPVDVDIVRAAYRCTAHAEFNMKTLTIYPSRANPMEVLHLLAHYVQPLNSPWHRGEFGGIFLDFIERQYDADMKRQVKDIMFGLRLPTFAKSEASRLKQSEAYHTKMVGQVPQGLVDILADIREIRS